MALHQKNLWIVTARPNSSLDVTDALGGLTAGCISIPLDVLSGVKGLRVFTTTQPTVPEDYGNFQALVTGLGGRSINGAGNGYATVEFDTSSSNTGSRGVYRVEGLFEREFHYHEALTKGEAMKFIAPHGIDEYNWTGTGTVKAGASKNLLTLGNYSTDVTSGDTTIQANAMVVLPATIRTRGVMLTVVMDGTYQGNGPHDFRFELRDANDSVVFQNAPMYALTNNVKKVTANFMVYTNGTGDELSTTGFKISFVNDSQSDVSISAVKIIAQTISNPDFTLS